jgi:nitrite reductase/ring-hydroxylating ferredoxin subunit
VAWNGLPGRRAVKCDSAGVAPPPRFSPSSSASRLLDRNSVAGGVFVSSAILELEYERIFSRVWLPVAREADLRHTGDLVTATMASDPVVVVRQPDGRIRVMINACRHLGLPVVRVARAHANVLRCAHRGWTYALDGSLIAVPGQDPENPAFEFVDWGMQGTDQVATSSGIVFARWEKGDEEEDLPPSDGREVPGRGIRELKTERFEIASNWKCAVETALQSTLPSGSWWHFPGTVYLSDLKVLVIIAPQTPSTTSVTVWGGGEPPIPSLVTRFAWTLPTRDRSPHGSTDTPKTEEVCANTGQRCETAASPGGCPLAHFVAAKSGNRAIPRRSVPGGARAFYQRWRQLLGEIDEAAALGISN